MEVGEVTSSSWSVASSRLGGGASRKPLAMPTSLSKQPGVDTRGLALKTSWALALSTSSCIAQATVLNLSDPRLHVYKVEITPALPTSQGFENCRC